MSGYFGVYDAKLFDDALMAIYQGKLNNNVYINQKFYSNAQNKSFNIGDKFDLNSVESLFEADFLKRDELSAKIFLKQIKLLLDKNNFDDVLFSKQQKKDNLLKYYKYGTKYLKARKAANKACEDAKNKFVQKFNEISEVIKDAEIDEEKLQKECEEASTKAFNDVMAGMDPPSGKGGNEKPSATKQVVSARLSEQAALMVNIKNIVNKEFNVSSKTKINRLNVKYNNFSVVRTKNSGHNRVTSRFTKNKDMAYFFDKLPTNVLSLLIPSIKIYKVFYPELHRLSNEQQKTGIKTTDIKYNQALKSSVHWRVPFDDTPVKYGKQTSDFAPDNLDDILNGNGSLRSVGIKSFNYEFSGNNPASAKAVVKASIKLFLKIRLI